MIKCRKYFFILWFLFCLHLAASEKQVISGTVRDEDSFLPLAGVLVELKELNLRTNTDNNGRYFFSMVPAGDYSFNFSLQDYLNRTIGPVKISSDSPTVIDAMLKIHLLTEVLVTGKYISSLSRPVGVPSLDSEEIRRNAGSAGDISRVLSFLPSIFQVNEMINALAVRGGSPGENAFFIDGIPVPDISHYPTPGSTGGPIGMLNVDFISNVSFSPGGFPANFGDRLSSILDISFREGTREGFRMQAELDVAGYGFSAEGPLAGKKGSWLLAVRRSYIDQVLKLIGDKSGIAPRYNNIQGKTVIDISKKHRITGIALAGFDRVGWTRERARETGNSFFGDNEGRQMTLGLNWAWTREKSGSITSLSCSMGRNRADYKYVSDLRPFMTNNSRDLTWSFRNFNHWTLGKSIQFSAGLETQAKNNDFNYFLRAYTDFWGQVNPDQSFRNRLNSRQSGGFAGMIISIDPFSLQVGVRADHNSLHKFIHFSPRLSLSLNFSAKTTLNLAYGWFHQALPLILLNQCPAAKKFGDMRANHLIAGIKHALREDLFLTVELYLKNYAKLPVDPANPLFFFVDELVYGGAYFPRSNLDNTGQAQSYGIEFTLQKKMAAGVYGLLSGSIFRSRYLDGTGKWRNRIFDAIYLLGLEGGIRPNRRWSMALSWKFSGGNPYTPFDLDISIPANAGIYDLKAVNSLRNPPLHSLNLRFDHHFFFKNGRLTAYLDIWNVYNNKNLGLRYWNSEKREEGIIRSWGILPIIGFEYRTEN